MVRDIKDAKFGQPVIPRYIPPDEYYRREPTSQTPSLVAARVVRAVRATETGSQKIQSLACQQFRVTYPPRNTIVGVTEILSLGSRRQRAIQLWAKVPRVPTRGMSCRLLTSEVAARRATSKSRRFACMGKAVNNLRLGYVRVRWEAACQLQRDARLQVHNPRRGHVEGEWSMDGLLEKIEL